MLVIVHSYKSSITETSINPLVNHVNLPGKAEKQHDGRRSAPPLLFYTYLTLRTLCTSTVELYKIDIFKLIYYASMYPSIADLRSALSSFASSANTFRVLFSIPSQSQSSSTAIPPPRTLYVLDSSFNPPTRAHLKIATSAVRQDKGAEPKRLILLLATQNADKGWSQKPNCASILPASLSFDCGWMMMKPS